MEITPSDSTVFNKLCYVCGATYQSTLKQNSELEEALIYEGTKDIRRSFWNGGDLREANYRVVKVFYTKCPNCGASVKTKVGCIPTSDVKQFRYANSDSGGRGKSLD